MHVTKQNFSWREINIFVVKVFFSSLPLTISVSFINKAYPNCCRNSKNGRTSDKLKHTVCWIHESHDDESVWLACAAFYAVYATVLFSSLQASWNTPWTAITNCSWWSYLLLSTALRKLLCKAPTQNTLQINRGLYLIFQFNDFMFQTIVS